MSPLELFDSLTKYAARNAAVVDNLLISLAVVATLLIARWLAHRVIDRRVEDADRYRWHKLSSYTITIVGIFLLGSIWLQQVTSNLTTYLGLLSAGVAIALREPLSNLAGWAYILWRHPFDLGDRIEIRGIKGDVIDKRIFAFTLMEVGNWVAAEQSTGRVTHVPNYYVFTDDVANYTQGFEFIWNEVPIVVTFESDWRQAKAIITRIGNEHAVHFTPEATQQMRRASSRFMISSGTLTPKVYTTVVDHGVRLTLRYLTKVRQRRGIEEAIWEDILDAFAAHPGIDFAYPTQRFYTFDQPKSE